MAVSSKILSALTSKLTAPALPLLAALTLASALVGCGGSSGQATQTKVNPDSGGHDNTLVYKGPAPQTEDIQRFKNNLWDKLAVAERCGACHGTDGQVPSFVRSDDINEAYRAVGPLVDLENPSLSAMVAKVGGGHNCWLDSNSACADIISGYIRDWAASAGSLSNEVVLSAPKDKTVGTSKHFTPSSADFAATVYPLTHRFCGTCHAEGAPLQQQPYIGSEDVDVAYQAARSRIRLDDASASRLVQRLGQESHNCWSDSCSNDAAAMQKAVQDLIDRLPLTEVDPKLVISKALQLGDGIVASAGGRVETNLIAKYEFKTGSGATAFDTSGVEPAADLTLSGDVDWMSSWGIHINNGKAQAATSTSRKLYDLITSTGEYSIEAWVIPDNVTQEDSRIVSYSGSTQVRNFTLGQTLYSYDFLNRSAHTDGNGKPALSSPNGDELLQASLQHVVATYDPVNGRQLYINGQRVELNDPAEPGSLNQWDSSFALVLGNEVSSDRLWKGSIRMLSIYNRALTPEAIDANYKAGVGQKYFLLFNISQQIGMDKAYIAFQVKQFDDYSYLFSEPFFVSLGDDAIPSFKVQGIRIGVNGREASVNQAFANLDAEVSAASTTAKRQSLSRLGAVIPMEQGSDFDTFFLTFERLGEHSHVRLEPEPPTPQAPANIDDQAQIGIKTFAEINASLAAMTGVDPSNPPVRETYQKVQQQLPSSSNINGFVAAQQMGITQLAVSYCNALVGNSGASKPFFPGFDFTRSAGNAFDASGREQIINPLLKALLAHKINGSALANQPDPSDVRSELNHLIDTMTACAGHCDAGRTYTVAKATCAAALGSAVMLIQ